jgi:hypothetical protein
LNSAAGDVADEAAPIKVTVAVTVPAAGAAGFVTLNVQLALPWAGRLDESQFETGTVVGAWPETVIAMVDIVVAAAAVFCTETVPETYPTVLCCVRVAAMVKGMTSS